MKRPFGIHVIADMISSNGNMVLDESYKWARAVPTPYPANRLLKAWWVFTGKAEAVIWPKAGELENALEVHVQATPSQPSKGE